MDIEEELMKAEIAILTGGMDIHGHPVVTFTTRGLPRIDKNAEEKLLRLLMYYTNVVRLIQQKTELAFVVDMRHGCSEICMATIIGALNKLEIHGRGTVAILYVLKPKSNVKAKLLKKLVGLKKSKGADFISHFKTMLLKGIPDLCYHIDLSQMTDEFGGLLSYHNEATIFFHKTVIPVMICGQTTLKRLPEVRDKVLLLQEYDTQGLSLDQLQVFLHELTEKYSVIMKESTIRDVVDQCKQVLHRLEVPEVDGLLSHIHPVVVAEVVTRLRQTYQAVATAEKELENLWISTARMFHGRIELEECLQEANKLCKDISEQYRPQMTGHPYIGATLSQAEIFRTHFTAALYEPLMKLLSKATDILKQIQRLGGENATKLKSVQDTVVKLSTTVRPFARQLHAFNETYVAVHIFHLVFEKSLKWYKRALKFLPASMGKHALQCRGNHVEVTVPSGWQKAVGNFRHKHPGPKEQHLARLDVYTPPSLPLDLQTDARNLAEKIRTIQAMFLEPKLDQRTVNKVMTWKRELLSSPVLVTMEERRDKDRHNVSKQKVIHTRAKPIALHENSTPHKKQTCMKNKGKSRTPKTHMWSSKETEATASSRSGGSSVYDPENKVEELYVSLGFAQDAKSFSTRNFQSNVDTGSNESLTVYFDTVVNHIKTITSSDLPSDQKFFHVGNFLSSLNNGCSPRNGKLDHFNPRSRTSACPSTYMRSKVLGNKRTPAHTVAELKRKLCKSMADISRISDSEDTDFSSPYCEERKSCSLQNLQHDLDDDSAPVYSNGTVGSMFYDAVSVDLESEEADDMSETTSCSSLGHHIERLSKFPPRRSQNGSTASRDCSRRYSDILDGSEDESQREVALSLERTEKLLRELETAAEQQQQTLDDLDDEGTPIEPLPSDLDYLQDDTFLQELSLQEHVGSLSSSNKSHRSLSTDHGYDSNTDHLNGQFMSHTYLRGDEAVT